MEIRLLVDEITRYLKAHPNAADTLEGVRKWWLGDLGRTGPVSRVQLALDQLMANGLLERRDIAGGQRLYMAGPGLRDDN